MDRQATLFTMTVKSTLKMLIQGLFRIILSLRTVHLLQLTKKPSVMLLMSIIISRSVVTEESMTEKATSSIFSELSLKMKVHR